MDVSNYTVAFGLLRAADRPRVGGKAASLGEMIAAGFPVPDGFCVTTAAFDQVRAACPHVASSMAELDLLAPDDLDAVRRVGAQVRAVLTSTPIPAPIEASIRQAFARAQQQAGPAARWAVRSSATDEDRAETSFAGQHDTYLGVDGIEALLDRIQACWASLYTDRALAYRRQSEHSGSTSNPMNGQTNGQMNGQLGSPQGAPTNASALSLAVVVQRMLAPEVSGVLFTVDPVGGHRGVACIDASWGLGDALVSGIVEADHYRIDRTTGQRLERRLGRKAVEIVASPAGTEQREVEPQRRARWALSDADLSALLQLAERVEAHYGQPQDIEWCIEHGRPWLLQARPITTLFPIPTAPEDRGHHVYISFGHMQGMTRAIRPLGIDTLRLLFPIGKRHDLDPCPVMRSAGGRIFLDVTPAMLRWPTRVAIPRALTLLDPRLAAMLGAVIDREEFLADDGRPRADLWLFGRRMFAPLLRQLIPSLLWRDPAANRVQFEHFVDDWPARWAQRLAQVEDPRARLPLVQALLGEAMQAVFRELVHVIATGIISWRVLGRLHRHDPRIEDLTRGLPGNVTTQMDLELGDIADQVRRSPALMARLREEIDALDRPGALDDLEGGPALQAAWRRFLAAYGHRAASEIDLCTPRWAEDPCSLLQSLAGMLRDPAVGGHRRQHREATERAEASARALVAEAPWPLRRLVRGLVARLRTGLALREHPKFMVVQGIAMARGALVEIGQHLVDTGCLGQVADLWWLDYEQLARGLAGEPLHAVVQLRRAEYAQHQARPVPRVITSDGEIPRLPDQSSASAGTLEGLSVSSGVVEGVARVVHDPNTEELRAGEILIAPFTDPGWTPLFIHAAALVMEIGGMMSHGSVVAREYGIPAVAGVVDATRTIRTGQRIRVDADAGRVTLLDPLDKG